MHTLPDLHAALEHMADLEVLRDLRDVDGLP
jgi:hypothetical protein